MQRNEVLSVVVAVILAFAVTNGAEAASDVGETRDALLQLQGGGFGTSERRAGQRDAAMTDPLTERSRRLFKHDTQHIGEVQPDAEIIEQGRCEPDDCLARQEFVQGEPAGPARIVGLRVDRDLALPGAREITVSWDLREPAASAAARHQPDGYHVLVIDGRRFRVFNVTKRVAAGLPVRNRGKAPSHPGNSAAGQGRRPPISHPHRQSLQPQREMTFHARLDRTVEIHVQPVFARGKENSLGTTNGAMEQSPYKPHKSHNSSYSVTESDGRETTLEPQETDDGRPPGEVEQRTIGDIEFSDSALSQCVAEAVMYDADYPADLVSELSCRDMGIMRLGGIEELRNLQVLDFSSNRIVDVSELSGLTQLVSLNLTHALRNDPYSDEPNPDLAPLGFLHGLRYLHLDGNSVSRLDELTGLSALDTLTAADNQVNYFPDFSATQLRVVDLASNPLYDISGVAPTVTLEEVILRDAYLGDL